MPEKRRLIRRHLLADVLIKPDGSLVWMPASVTNIHKSGVCLYSTGPLKKGEKTRIKITYLKKGRLKKTEEITGTVRWKAKIAGYFAVGIKFNETINEKTHPLMSQCLEYAKGK
ncbi:PilZ domain-containing protein [bacterium]|nr:MAG: PilZ domain-containing protein [bacterium]